MCYQLFFVSQTREVVADHLVSAFRGFAVGPQANQHAADDRTVALNLNSVAAVADEVATAQHVFEEAKEDFDCPTVLVNQRDGLGGNIHQVRADTQDPVAVVA